MLRFNSASAVRCYSNLDLRIFKELRLLRSDADPRSYFSEGGSMYPLSLKLQKGKLP